MCGGRFRTKLGVKLYRYKPGMVGQFNDLYQGPIGAGSGEQHAVRRELECGALRELPVSELPLLRSWCLVHPRGKYLSPVAQAFFAFVRDQRSQINALAERFAASTPASQTAQPGS